MEHDHLLFHFWPFGVEQPQTAPHQDSAYPSRLTRRQITDELINLADRSSKTENHQMTASLYFLASCFVGGVEADAADALLPISRGRSKGSDAN